MEEDDKGGSGSPPGRHGRDGAVPVRRGLACGRGLAYPPAGDVMADQAAMNSFHFWIM